MNKVRIIRTVCAIGVFVASWIGIYSIMYYTVEPYSLGIIAYDKTLSRFIFSLVFFNSVTASTVFNILFKRRFDESIIK
jgi:hypothetical protein